MNLLAYTPFINPLPIWLNPWYWPLLLLPLSLAVAVVYKTIKCEDARQIPRQTFEWFVYIIGAMAAVAAGLALLAAWMG